MERCEIQPKFALSTFHFLNSTPFEPKMFDVLWGRKRLMKTKVGRNVAHMEYEA